MGGEPKDALAFYGEMFGWRAGEAHDMGPMGVYQLFRNQDGEVGEIGRASCRERV